MEHRRALTVNSSLPPPIITETYVLPSFKAFHEFVAGVKIEMFHLMFLNLLPAYKSTLIFMQINYHIK